MRDIVLYTATSLDGFIARKNGRVDWLFTDYDYGYFDFLETVDTTLMGGKTYRQILTFGDFPYQSKANYVFTKKHKNTDNKNVTIISKEVIPFVKDLKGQKGKAIWLIGGGQINTLLLNAGLINKLILSIHPIVLGDGIRLFKDIPKETSWKVRKTQSFLSGLIQIHYTQ